MSTGNHWPRAPGYGSGPGLFHRGVQRFGLKKIWYNSTLLRAWVLFRSFPHAFMSHEQGTEMKELWIPDKLLYNLVSSQHHIGAGIPLEKEVPFPVWGHMYKSLCKPPFHWNSEITDIPVLRIWFSRSSRIIGIGNPHNPQNILSFSEFIKQFIKSRNVRNIQKHSSPTYWF